MKTNQITLWAVALLALVFLVFARTFKAGKVTGSFTPQKSVADVWIYSAKDTVKGNVLNDAFDVSNVKAGTYTLVIDAMPPYKSITRTGLIVSDGETTNIGQIIMQQDK